MPSEFRVSLFGFPHVVRLDAGGPRNLSWTLRRALKAFIFLASSPEHRANREQLVEAVWADEDEAAVERNFHPTLSHLRRTLAGGRGRTPPPLIFRGGIYQLNPNLQWRIDAAEFDALSQRGRQRADSGDLPGAIELWQAAWRLYTGPFLEGLYEPWADQRREGFVRRYLDLLRRLADAQVEIGDSGRALDSYRALLVSDPLQERVHVAVMRLYARQARRDLVRKQYDRLSDLLREELGVEPLPETTAEYHRLMG
jgi:DNA-binding SARP family transcriptional activator